MIHLVKYDSGMTLLQVSTHGLQVSCQCTGASLMQAIEDGSPSPSGTRAILRAQGSQGSL